MDILKGKKIPKVLSIHKDTHGPVACEFYNTRQTPMTALIRSEKGNSNFLQHTITASRGEQSTWDGGGLV